MDLLLPMGVILLAAFTQSLSGFGVALVSMALLPGLVDVQVATPFVALVALTLEFFLLLRYRVEMNIRLVKPIALASILGIPIGVWALKRVDEDLFLFILGVVVTGYALYALLNLRLPKLRHQLWSYGVGFVAGILGGAYNTSGPPVILYGNSQGWSPGEFKGNLQGFFLVNSIFVIANHALLHNLTSRVWEYYLWSLPAIGLGLILGISLDRYINPELFRKLVLIMLVGMGIRLIW